MIDRSAQSDNRLPTVAVVGGGLAGMAAAVALESTGARVVLLEARRDLGGRAGSYRASGSDDQLDNCQHVLLGCCTALRDFYRRLGVENLIQFEDSIWLLNGSGQAYRLRAVAPLPAPLHLAASFFRLGLLTWPERAALGRAVMQMMALGREARDALGELPFGTWLARMRQPHGLVRKLYAPLLTGALNEEPERVSARYAIQVFQEALLVNAAGYPLGLPRCPLRRLYEHLPLADVRLGRRVRRLLFEGTVARGVELEDGQTIDADAVVWAAGRWGLPSRVDPRLAALDCRLRDLHKFEDVPILGTSLHFDRPVMTSSHAALVDGPLQWLFRRDGEGRILHGVISAARQWLGVDRQEMLRRFLAQVHQVFPKAREAQLLRSSIVIEKRATFSPSPGVDRFRPAQAPPPDGLARLYLAGDFTQTDWPACMEGAVRSGYLAAEAVARDLFPAKIARFCPGSLSPQWPAQMAVRADSEQMLWSRY